uniref:Uncharacterized protein n=1 Tax=Panagrolaimus sp. ES5 TaxID=591445 RepID=A0AC34FTT4_9BILA
MEAMPTLFIFAEKDILLLKNKKNSVVATIVAQSEASSETKEEMARFLNALSSFKRGREYLLSIFQGKELLYHLALALRTKKLVGFSAEHTVATLEKLSVKASVQKELVLSGMIEWTLMFLENSPTSFGYEYGIALLTNLFLHSVSQSTIFRYKDKVLALLTKLLESTSLQLISFAANAMYTLFTFAKMRSAAKEIKFEQNIEKCLQRIDGSEVESQLLVILRILHGEFDPQQLHKRQQQQQQHDSGGDDEIHEDYIEAEIDSTDTLIPTMTELFGEMLITKKYSLQQSSNSSATAINDDIAPPGTVPRRHIYPLSHRDRDRGIIKGTPRKGINNNGNGNMTGIISKKQLRENNVIPPVPLPPSTPPDQRMSSVASYATFIAENDRRRPLLGHTGLKAAGKKIKIYL